MSIKTLKNFVIQRRTNGQVKKGNALAKAIIAYEKSRITSDYLMKYFLQLQAMK